MHPGTTLKHAHSAQMSHASQNHCEARAPHYAAYATCSVEYTAKSHSKYHHKPVVAGLLTGAALAIDVLVLDTDEVELAEVTAAYNACKQ